MCTNENSDEINNAELSSPKSTGGETLNSLSSDFELDNPVIDTTINTNTNTNTSDIEFDIDSDGNFKEWLGTYFEDNFDSPSTTSLNTFEATFRKLFPDLESATVEIIVKSVTNASKNNDGVISNDIWKHAFGCGVQGNQILILPNSIEKEARDVMYALYQRDQAQRKKKAINTKGSTVTTKKKKNNRPSSLYCGVCWQANSSKRNDVVTQHTCPGKPVAGIFPGRHQCSECEMPLIKIHIRQYDVNCGIKPTDKSKKVPHTIVNPQCPTNQVKPTDTNMKMS